MTEDLDTRFAKAYNFQVYNCSFFFWKHEAFSKK